MVISTVNFGTPGTLKIIHKLIASLFTIFSTVFLVFFAPFNNFESKIWQVECAAKQERSYKDYIRMVVYTLSFIRLYHTHEISGSSMVQWQIPFTHHTFTFLMFTRHSSDDSPERCSFCAVLSSRGIPQTIPPVVTLIHITFTCVTSACDYQLNHHSENGLLYTYMSVDTRN